MESIVVYHSVDQSLYLTFVLSIAVYQDTFKLHSSMIKA